MLSVGSFCSTHYAPQFHEETEARIASLDQEVGTYVSPGANMFSRLMTIRHQTRAVKATSFI